jgi:hypothetical protein
VGVGSARIVRMLFGPIAVAALVVSLAIELGLCPTHAGPTDRPFPAAMGRRAERPRYHTARSDLAYPGTANDISMGSFQLRDRCVER